MAVDVDAPERELSARGELSEDDSSHGDDAFTEQRDTQKRRHRTVLRRGRATSGAVRLTVDPTLALVSCRSG